MKPKKKKEPGEIEISMEDVELIMGKDFKHVDIYLSNFYCPNCSIVHQKKIVNYTQSGSMRRTKYSSTETAPGAVTSSSIILKDSEINLF